MKNYVDPCVDRAAKWVSLRKHHLCSPEENLLKVKTLLSPQGSGPIIECQGPEQVGGYRRDIQMVMSDSHV